MLGVIILHCFSPITRKSFKEHSNRIVDDYEIDKWIPKNDTFIKWNMSTILSDAEIVLETEHYFLMENA